MKCAFFREKHETEIWRMSHIGLGYKRCLSLPLYRHDPSTSPTCCCWNQVASIPTYTPRHTLDPSRYQIDPGSAQQSLRASCGGSPPDTPTPLVSPYAWDTKRLRSYRDATCNKDSCFSVRQSPYHARRIIPWLSVVIQSVTALTKIDTNFWGWNRHQCYLTLLPRNVEQ